MRKILQLTSQSLNSLRKNKKQSMLTLLGIVVGTGVLVLVLSLGQGLEQFIMRQLGSFNPNSIFVEVQTPPSSRAGAFAALNITTLSEEDRDDLAEIDGITHASGWYTSQNVFAYGNENKTATILGVNKDFPVVQFLPVATGRFFNQQEDENGEKVVVLGKDLAEELQKGERKPILNERIKLGSQRYLVIGIADEVDASAGLNLNEMGFVPLKSGQKYLWSETHLQAIAMRMENPEEVNRLKWRMENVLRKNHDIDAPDDDDFAVRTFDQILDIVGDVISGINYLLSSLAGISLLVGGVGIMNVMYASVSERTKEIGLRKSLGAPPSLILFQFLFEALMLSIIGGLAGAAIGVGLAYGISLLAANFGFGWDFSIPWAAIGLAVGVSIIIGLVFGYRPAQKASKLDPILALRSEA